MDRKGSTDSEFIRRTYKCGFVTDNELKPGPAALKKLYGAAKATDFAERQVCYSYLLGYQKQQEDVGPLTRRSNKPVEAAQSDWSIIYKRATDAQCTAQTRCALGDEMPLADNNRLGMAVFLS